MAQGVRGPVVVAWVIWEALEGALGAGFLARPGSWVGKASVSVLVLTVTLGLMWVRPGGWVWISALGPGVTFPLSSASRKNAENMYYFSELALTLNAWEGGTAPTDSRLRPDQRLMENGRWDEANAEKQRLEEKQRMSRKRREAEAVRATEDGRGQCLVWCPGGQGGVGSALLTLCRFPPQAHHMIPTRPCGSSAGRTRSPRNPPTSTGESTGIARRNRTGVRAQTFSEGHTGNVDGTRTGQRELAPPFRSARPSRISHLKQPCGGDWLVALAD